MKYIRLIVLLITSTFLGSVYGITNVTIQLANFDPVYTDQNIQIGWWYYQGRQYDAVLVKRWRCNFNASVVQCLVMYIHPDRPNEELLNGLYYWRHDSPAQLVFNRPGFFLGPLRQNQFGDIYYYITPQLAQRYNVNAGYYAQRYLVALGILQPQIYQPVTPVSPQPPQQPQQEPATLINKNFFQDVVGMDEQQFRTTYNWQRGQPVSISNLSNWIAQYSRRIAIFQGKVQTATVNESTQTMGTIPVHTGMSVGEFDQAIINKQPLTQAPHFLIQFYDSAKTKESDIRWLQANPDLKYAVFQVASNFNTLEGGMGNPKALITDMLRAAVQGELASISAAPATIYRKYFMTPFNLLHRLKGKGIWMQEDDGFANPTFTSLKNIYNGTIKLDISNDYKDVAVALHDNVVVTSGNGGGRSYNDVISRLPVVAQGVNVDTNRTQIISQVFTAALDTYTLRSGKGRGGKKFSTLWNKNIEDFCKLLIKGSYEGTIKAAFYAGKPRVILTLMGGGSFRNDVSWIADALEGLETFIKTKGMQVLLMYRADKPRDTPVRSVQSDTAFLKRMVHLANRINNTNYNLDATIQQYVTKAYAGQSNSSEAQTLQAKFPVQNFYKATIPVQPPSVPATGVQPPPLTVPQVDELSTSLQKLTQKLRMLGNMLKADISSTKKVLTKVDDTTYKVGNKTIKLLTGDITAQKNIDVLVNAANVKITTVGTGGIAKAINNKMTQEDQKAFAQDIQRRYNITQGQVGGAYIGQLQTGSFLHNLGYKYLINAVGPNCKKGQSVQLVANAYQNSLQEAAKLNMGSIVLPRISAILFGCPAQTIDRLAVDTVVDYLVTHPTSSITTVYFIFYPGQPLDMTALNDYKSLLNGYVK